MIRSAVRAATRCALAITALHPGFKLRNLAYEEGKKRGSLHVYLKRAQAAGVSWPLPEGWDESRLEEALFGPSARRVYESHRSIPDFALLHEELQTHRHLTLQLWWEEYHQNHPDGYSYTRLCELYQRWRRHLDVVLRQEHKAGEKLFVDYAGDTIPIYDPRGGPELPASLFVAVLGASNYTWGTSSLLGSKVPLVKRRMSQPRQKRKAPVTKTRKVGALSQDSFKPLP